MKKLQIYQSKKLNDSDESEIVRLYNNKEVIRNISKKFNCNHWCIYKVLRKHGCKIYGLKTSFIERFGEEVAKKKGIITANREREQYKGKHFSPNSEFKKGMKPMRTGKILSIESIKKIKIGNKGKHNSPATEFKKGMKISPEQLQKIKKKWSDQEYKSVQLKKMMSGASVSPNKCENKIINIINNYNIHLNYVGDWKKVIDGFNPDFINEDKKLIVEYFGNYWHNKKDVNERDNRKILAFHKKGYSVFIIHDEDLKDETELKNRLQEITK